MKRFLLPTIFLLAISSAGSLQAQTRLKDIAVVQGVRGNQIFGYGLVVGLDGTGDGSGAVFTPQTVASMLLKFNIQVPAAALKLKNVAAVMVTASLPPFVHNGSAVDVTVSSLGDAKSLQGGTLLQTPLQAANGTVYAVGQGAISVGGFLAGGSGASVTKNHVTAGRIPGGATVEQEVPTSVTGTGEGYLEITLNEPDYTTSARVASAIRRNMPDGVTSAHALDAGTIRIDYSSGTDSVGLIAALEVTPVSTDQTAKIVINERTGTVVMGGNVSISQCAIAHGDLTIQITNDPVVSQPLPLSKGSTTVVHKKSVTATEGNQRLVSVPPSSDINKVVRSLNALGVTPRDLIAILQAMKDAGALHADIEIQ